MKVYLWEGSKSAAAYDKVCKRVSMYEHPSKIMEAVHELINTLVKEAITRKGFTGIQIVYEEEDKNDK
jgi:hypothetical protein